MPAGSVKRVKVHLPAHDLMPDTIRGVASRASCSCGYRGPSRKTYAEARKDLRLHRLDVHT
jgi:hypothetical protein